MYHTRGERGKKNHSFHQRANTSTSRLTYCTHKHPEDSHTNHWSNTWMQKTENICKHSHCDRVNNKATAGWSCSAFDLFQEIISGCFEVDKKPNAWDLVNEGMYSELHHLHIWSSLASVSSLSLLHVPSLFFRFGPSILSFSSLQYKWLN